MRDSPVPCVNATQFETLNGRHQTWEDNRVCTRCARIQDMFAQRRALNEQFEETMVDEV